MSRRGTLISLPIFVGRGEIFAMNPAAPKHTEALKVSTAVVTAWRDTRAALSALLTPALVMVLILWTLFIVMVATRALLILNGMTTSAELVGLPYGLAVVFFLTPYAIAVHRFIILGEKTTSYRIASTEPRFRRFFGWSLVFLVLSSATQQSFDVDVVLGGPVLALAVLAFVFAIRAIVLYPAVAVDAPGANWRQAIADTRGHAWRILFIILGAILPLVILALIVWLLVAGVGHVGPFFHNRRRGDGAWLPLGDATSPISLCGGWIAPCLYAPCRYRIAALPTDRRQGQRCG